MDSPRKILLFCVQVLAVQNLLILYLHFSISIPLRLYDVNVNDVVVREVTLGTVTGGQCWDRSVTETEAV